MEKLTKLNKEVMLKINEVFAESGMMPDEAVGHLSAYLDLLKEFMGQKGYEGSVEVIREGKVISKDEW